MSSTLTTEELAKHNTQDDLWIAIDSQVWDVTTFLALHPGGASIIFQHGGTDATKAYSQYHPLSLVKNTLPPSMLVGTIASSTPPSSTSPTPSYQTDPISSTLPDLSTLISVPDFYAVAPRYISRKAHAYVSSWACDGFTNTANRRAWDEVYLRPRVLRPVASSTARTTLFSHPVVAPLFAAPTALAKVVHREEGEMAIARGCAAAGVAVALSTGASCDVADVRAALDDEMGESTKVPFIFQLYVHKDRALTEKLLRRVVELGVDAVFLTVDAPLPGKREADERLLIEQTIMQQQQGGDEKSFRFHAPMTGIQARNDAKGGALGRVMGTFIDADLCWKDIQWVRSLLQSSGTPLYVKGIQTAMDARLAMEAGADGIVVSNHGGRSVDTSPPTLLVLLELHRCCPEVFERMEVFVDGGIMRGTDVFKALCLGARAVGVGRGVMYGLTWGKEGVAKVFSILQDELLTTMKMCGARTLDELHPGLLNTFRVDNLIPTADDHPYAKKTQQGSKL